MVSQGGKNGKHLLEMHWWGELAEGKITHALGYDVAGTQESMCMIFLKLLQRLWFWEVLRSQLCSSWKEG